MKLKELHIHNFKFFPKQDSKSPLLKIDGKNLLIYGENGSGKSTIYWAIYTLLESSFKNKNADVGKYFTKGGEGLVNIHAPKNHNCHIKAVLTDGTDYLVSGNTSEIESIRKSSNIRESGMASDFINYRVLFALHQVKNSKENDLFPWFEQEILPYIRIKFDSFLDTLKPLREGPAKVKDLFGDEIYPYAAMRDDPNDAVKKDYEFYKKFEIRVRNWNSNFKKFIKKTEKRSNEILKDDFKQIFALKLDFTPAKFSTTADKFDWSEPEIKIVIPKFQGKRNAISKPHTFLNEAKWTAIGLSIRLAIIEDDTVRPTTAELKCLVLDDMLLSLDMSNRDIVLNLLLDRYSKDYQLILMTHDKLFFEVAKHKINTLSKKEKWHYLEMFTGEKNLQKIEYPIISGDSDDYYDKAEKYFLRKKDGRVSDIDYPAAANYLRKECEVILKNLLYGKYIYKENNTGEIILKDELGELFIAFRQFINDHDLDFSDFSKYQTVVKLTLNPLSHDNLGKPIYKREIEDAFNFVDNLRLISKKKILSENDNLFLTVTDAVGVNNTFKIKILNDLYIFKQKTLIKSNINLSKFSSNEYEKGGTQTFFSEQINHLNKLYDKAHHFILNINDASTGKDIFLEFMDDKGYSLDKRIKDIS